VTARLACSFVLGCMIVSVATTQPASGFDHEYSGFAALLTTCVRGPRVDYAALHRNRAPLDRVTSEFAAPARAEELAWTRPQRLAFWINAYNALTLRAIVDHYPIRAGWFALGPRNSIRQIDGVWTALTWDAAGRKVSLDDIEHRILRPEFGDARIHFAINCASVSCPPLAALPYRPVELDAQLDESARAYLASPHGLRVERDRLYVSSIFKWYGDDFIERYAAAVPGNRPPRERAILGAIAEHGPPAAAVAARAGTPAIRYLEYDWSLNDTTPR
jgi:hypothetical protein